MATYTRDLTDTEGTESSFTFAVTAGPPPPGAPMVLAPYFVIYPFPTMVDCCYPIVSCVKKSANGRLYVPAKTALNRGY